MKCSAVFEKRMSRVKSSTSYIQGIIRAHDKPGYMTGIFMPEKVRNSYWTIRAFNFELAKLRENVRGHELSGRLRFQWWREMIDDLYNGKTDSLHKSHPLYADLDYSIKTFNLTRRWFDRIIDAREDDMTLDQPESIVDLEDYAEKTASSMMYLSLELLDTRDIDADHVASHVGKTIGVSTTLYGFPQLIAAGQVRLPRELMKLHGLRHTNYLSLVERKSGDAKSLAPNPEDLSKLSDVIYDVASCAHGHLAHAREMQHKVKPQARVAFLPVVHYATFLDKLQSVAQFDIFHKGLWSSKFGPFPLQYQMTKAFWTGKF